MDLVDNDDGRPTDAAALVGATGPAMLPLLTGYMTALLPLRHCHERIGQLDGVL